MEILTLLLGPERRPNSGPHPRGKGESMLEPGTTYKGINDNVVTLENTWNIQIELWESLIIENTTKQYQIITKMQPNKL